VELSREAAPGRPGVVVVEHRREAAERLVRARGWDGLPVERVFGMPSIFTGSVDRRRDAGTP